MVPLPMYCVQNFWTSNTSNKATIGDAVMDTISAPKNVRGTTPGYSKWSYYKVR